MNTLLDPALLATRLRSLPMGDWMGRISKVVGLVVESTGPDCSVGEQMLIHSTDAAGNLEVAGKFGVNSAASQAAYASGGAAPAGGTGTAAGGWDTAAHRDAAITLLNNIRTALVNAGIMS